MLGQSQFGMKKKIEPINFNYVVFIVLFLWFEMYGKGFKIYFLN